MSRQSIAKAPDGSSRPWERIAYFALLAVPAVVPVVVFKTPFVAGPALTLNPAVIPKLFAFATLIGVALAAWAIDALKGDVPIRSVPLTWWLVAFLALSALSTALGLSPTTSFFGSGEYATGLVVLLLGAALLFLVVQLISTPGRIRALSWSVVAGGTIVAAVGLLQAVGADPMGLNLEYNYQWLRVGSLLGNSDSAGSYLVIPLIIAAALVFSTKDAVARMVWSGCFVTILLCLLSTGTRGAWLGAVVGLVALGFALLRGGGKLTKSVYVAIGVAAGLPLVWALVSMKSLVIRFADFSQGSAVVGGGRIPIWTDALRVIAARPLFGTGPDAYLLGWSGARAPAWVGVFGSTNLVDDPHSIVLLFGATLGIPATIAVVGLVVRAIAASAGLALRPDAGLSRYLYAGWWAELIGFAVTLLFTFNTVTMVVMLFLSLGVVLTVMAKPVGVPKLLRQGLGIAAIVLAMAASTISTRYVAADVLLAAAQRSPDRIAILDRAVRLAPWYGEARSRATRARGDAALAALEAGSETAQSDARFAETRFEELVAYDPWNLRYRMSQAGFLVNAGGYLGPDVLTRAVAAGRAAEEINPGNPRAAFIAALAQTKLGDPEAAIDTLKPVWNLDPKYPDPGILYGQALVSVGSRAEAGAVLASLRQRFPDNVQVAGLGSLVESSTGAP